MADVSSSALQSHHLVVAGRRIHYFETGHGPPLVLLHGTAIDSARLSYGPVIPALARRYRVLALDWPGYGESEYPPEIPTVRDYVTLLGRFAQQLELPPFYLLGFSMGGAVALGTALETPDRVRALVLAGSYGLGQTQHVPLLPYVALRTPRFAANVLLGLRLSRQLTRIVLERLVFAHPRAVTRELVDEVHAQLRRPLVERAFVGWLRGELGPLRYGTSYSRMLESLRPPTLLIHGSRDLVVPVRSARRAAERIPGAKLTELPRTGHWLMRERPDAFEEAVLGFLGEQELGRRGDAE
jgi:pimeloyl-ACP methyl ester carboxylesterase